MDYSPTLSDPNFTLILSIVTLVLGVVFAVFRGNYRKAIANTADEVKVIR